MKIKNIINLLGPILTLVILGANITYAATESKLKATDVSCQGSGLQTPPCRSDQICCHQVCTDNSTGQPCLDAQDKTKK